MNVSGPNDAPATSIDQFDLEAYASSYTGLTKISRLKFIADKCGIESMRLEALRMAVDEVRKGENTALYRELMEKVGERLGPDYVYDKEWVESVDRRAAIRQEKLDMELQGYKANLIKESIRMGLNDLGDFLFSRGDIQQAFKYYVRTRDYCTTSKHIISMCLNVIIACIELGHFMNVSNYVQKAEQTPDVQDVLILSKLKASAGLALLENSKYNLAAYKFTETSFEISNQFNHVISSQDIAIYGSLCALATFQRNELKTQVIDNINFRNFLELVPEVRELIHDFYASRYASCLNYLKKLRPMLALDVHLHDHVDALYSLVRSKALIQYTAPFISVDLTTMALAFDTSLDSLERELVNLIMDNMIQARIDSHSKVLYARNANQRNISFQNATQMVSDYLRNTKALILRMNILRNDLIIRSSSRGKLV